MKASMSYSVTVKEKVLIHLIWDKYDTKSALLKKGLNSLHVLYNATLASWPMSTGITCAYFHSMYQG